MKNGFCLLFDQIQLDALKQSALAARGIAQQGQSAQVQALQPISSQQVYGAVNPLESWQKQQKTQLLKELMLIFEPKSL